MIESAVEYKEVSVTGTLHNGRAKVYAYLVFGGSAASSGILRNGGAGGVIKGRLNAPIADSRVVSLRKPVVFGTDIHVTVDGTGAVVGVYYRPF